VVGILVGALVCVLHTSHAPIDVYETVEVIRRLLIDMDAEFGSKILNQTVLDADVAPSRARGGD